MKQASRHHSAAHSTPGWWLSIGLVSLLALGGCGGGSSGTDATSSASDTAPPATTIPTDSAPRVAAQLKAVYQVVSGRTALQWTDPLPDEQNFEVQRLSATQWVPVERVAAQTGQGLPVQWEGTLEPGTVVRVIATTPQGAKVLTTDNQADSLTVASNAGTLALALGAAEPLSGSVAVSIAGLSKAVAVQYLVDLHQQTRVTVGPTFAWNWSSAGVSDGTHLLQAVVETTANSFVELRREVTVDNPNVSVSLSAQAQSNATVLTVRTSSSAGIAQVALSVDGVARGTLTAPNACDYKYCTTGLNAYGFTLAHSLLGHGSHTARAVVTDQAGEVRESQQTFQVNSAPVITLTQPAAGAVLIGDTLTVQGSVEDDTPGVKVSVKVGDVTLPHDGSASFNLSYPLNGLPNGMYTLQVQATDAQGVVTQVSRSFVRQSGSPFTYTTVRTLGSSGALLASRGADVLVQQNAAVQWLRPQGDVTLQQADVQYASNWQLGALGASTYGVDAGSATSYQVYFWGPDGLRRNLSAEAGSSGGFDEHVTSSGDWQVWSTRTPGLAYFLMNTSTRQSFRIAMPSDAQYSGNWQFTLIPGGSGARVYYWAALSNSTPQTYAVYRYDSGTGQSTRLTAAGTSWRDTYVQTDGRRIAWQRNASSSGIDAPYTLMVAELGNDTQSTALSTTMQQFMMGDGLLAWSELTGSNSTLKVHDGNQVTVLSQQTGASLAGVGGAAVAYLSGGTLWLWTPAAGARQVLSASAQNVQLSIGGLYLTLSDEKALVRVTGW